MRRRKKKTTIIWICFKSSATKLLYFWSYWVCCVCVYIYICFVFFSVKKSSMTRRCIQTWIQHEWWECFSTTTQCCFYSGCLPSASLRRLSLTLAILWAFFLSLFFVFACPPEFSFFRSRSLSLSIFKPQICFHSIKQNRLESYFENQICRHFHLFALWLCYLVFFSAQNSLFLFVYFLFLFVCFFFFRVFYHIIFRSLISKPEYSIYVCVSR